MYLLKRHLVKKDKIISTKDLCFLKDEDLKYRDGVKKLAKVIESLNKYIADPIVLEVEYFNENQVSAYNITKALNGVDELKVHSIVTVIENFRNQLGEFVVENMKNHL